MLRNNTESPLYKAIFLKLVGWYVHDEFGWSYDGCPYYFKSVDKAYFVASKQKSISEVVHGTK
jgi:hypothetical protein